MKIEMRRCFSRRDSGFSLVELIVVVAVIAILSAVIFPVVMSAKENSRKTTCLCNLMQLGKGIRLYADQWNDHFPIARLDIGGHKNPRGNWAGVYELHGVCKPTLGQIYPYVRNVGVYLCPDDKGVKASQITAPNAQPYPLSYSMNNLSDYRTSSTMAASSKVGLLIHEDRQSINDGDFYWYGWSNHREGQDRPGSMHNGGTCIVYCDLHTGWQKYEAVIQALRNREWDPLNVSR